MKKLLLLLITTATYAAETGTYWQCIAHDGYDKHWVAGSHYELVALNKAYEACKKESPIPATCKKLREHCDMFVNGVSTRPMWRCTAYDQMAKSWPSSIYRQRDDAAVAAKTNCQNHSGFPETCFVNLITCKNLNRKT